MNVNILSYPQAVKEIVRSLAADQCGFVATIVSPWHALGVDAWLHHLRSSGDTRGGIVLLLPHPTGGRLFSEEDLPVCLDDPQVKFLHAEGHLSGPSAALILQLIWLSCRMLRLVLTPRGEAGTPFYIASPRVPDLFALLHIFHAPTLRNRSIRFVLLDEGLATYMNASAIDPVRRVDRKHLKRGNVARELDILIRKTYHRVHGWLTRRYQSERRFLFHAPLGQDALSVCPATADDYRAVTGQRYRCEVPFRVSGKKALIVPQPWSEYGQVEAEDESVFFASLIEQVQAAGYHAVIKPHPRETEGKYDQLIDSTSCQLLDSPDSVETYFAQLGPDDIVLGHNTTSLLTAAALFGLKTYTLGNALSEQTSTGPVFRDFQTRFNRLAGTWVSDVRELLRRAAA